MREISHQMIHGRRSPEPPARDLKCRRCGHVEKATAAPTRGAVAICPACGKGRMAPAP